MKENTKIAECRAKCKHEWQDAKYGEGNRLHNAFGAKDKVDYHCTVCGNSLSGVARKK